MVPFLALLVLGVLGVFESVDASRLWEPRAWPEAMVTMGRVRFTVLTERMMRIEVAKEEATFDDRATLAVVNRRLQVPQFQVERPNATSLIITTSKLRLSYLKAEKEESLLALSVQVLPMSPPAIWRPGLEDPLNLNGTLDINPAGFAGGLDCYSNPKDCSQAYPQLCSRGLLSRSGWAIVNDTNTTRLMDSSGHGFAWVDGASTRAANRPLLQDFYFLGPGFEYKLALSDWAAISGRPALPPLHAFGIWFSHYHPFSDQEYLQDVVEGYASRGLPLNVAVLDLQWHNWNYQAHDAEVCNNWGGYTPNSTMFPKFVDFVEQLHLIGLSLILSNHGQTGVCPYELHYEELADALKLPQEFRLEKTTIQCAMDNETWADAFSRIILYAEPLQNVDHWWNDFPGCATEITGWGDQQPATLMWTNMVMDHWRRNLRSLRSLLLSRYGGLGSQRHGIGFSGDTFQNFTTLQFQVEMTSTASNVLFGYWSHDIGGNHNGQDCIGDSDPKSPGAGELMLRWVQFGVFSPIFRTHGAPVDDRYLWHFSTFDEMVPLLRFRNALVPYIYTMARKAYDSGVSMLRPMYYEFPEVDLAYQFPAQYWFGDDILVAPISSSVSVATHDVLKEIWLPPGKKWLHWAGDAVENIGPSGVLARRFRVSDIPIFVGSGTVLPLRTMASVRKNTADPLVWLLWLGDAAKGSGRLYEDEGDGLDYEDEGKTPPESFATCVAEFVRSSQALHIKLFKTFGSYRGQPATRQTMISLRSLPSHPATIVLNGEALPERHGRGKSDGRGWRRLENAGTEGKWLETAGAHEVDLGVVKIAEDVVIDIVLAESSEVLM